MYIISLNQNWGGSFSQIVHVHFGKLYYLNLFCQICIWYHDILSYLSSNTGKSLMMHVYIEVTNITYPHLDTHDISVV